MAKGTNFKSMDSLKGVSSVINDASMALQDKRRVILDSEISDVLGAVVGGGAGAGISFAALFFGGKVVGLSAAGITSGLAAAGKLVGGGMAAGVGVLAAPIAGLAVGGGLLVANKKRKRLKQEKERLLQEAIEKHHAITRALKEEVDATKDRADYLNALNIMLRKAIEELKSDLIAA
ncbi:MAG: hypothetical protein FWG63_02070 [Defluviitaleaceae bacterium]|nr:hypothetical protein [Defluviitaleaceae bacterium]